MWQCLDGQNNFHMYNHCSEMNIWEHGNDNGCYPLLQNLISNSLSIVYIFFYVILDWIVLHASKHWRISQHNGFESALRRGNQLPHLFKDFSFLCFFENSIKTGGFHKTASQWEMETIGLCETNGGADRICKTKHSKEINIFMILPAMKDWNYLIWNRGL